MTLLGIDLNSSRARAVSGASGAPRPLTLDEIDRDLPLAISLERRRPEVGRSGAALCRRLPHLACLDFLAQLGTARDWKAGRHRLDAAAAVALVLTRLQAASAGLRGLALALPAYLSRAQAGKLAALAVKARLPLLGSVTAPLAAAWTAHYRQPWRGLAVVLDVDEHALSCTVVSADDQVRLVVDQAVPALSLRIWKERILDGIADRCIRQSRRDLRDSAVAEQTLYDQLDEACDLTASGQPVELAIQAAHWYQNVIVTADELSAYCRPLAAKTLKVLATALEAADAEGPPAVILLSDAAARLPGLAAALSEQCDDETVTVLPPDAAARAAHDLAERWRSGQLPSGHIDVSLPLLRPSAAQARQAPKSTLRQGNTQLPKGAKLNLPDDDFSVTIDE